MPQSSLGELDEQAVLIALANPIRLRIMRHVLSRKEASVTAMAAELDLAQATVSQHLKVLREAALLERRRAKTLIFYKVVHHQTFAVMKALDAVFHPRRSHIETP